MWRSVSLRAGKLSDSLTWFLTLIQRQIFLLSVLLLNTNKAIAPIYYLTYSKDHEESTEVVLLPVGSRLEPRKSPSLAEMGSRRRLLLSMRKVLTLPPNARLGVGPEEGRHMYHRSKNGSKGRHWTKEACPSNLGKERIHWRADPPEACKRVGCWLVTFEKAPSLPHTQANINPGRTKKALSLAQGSWFALGQCAPLFFPWIKWPKLPCGHGLQEEVSLAFCPRGDTFWGGSHTPSWEHVSL